MKFEFENSIKRLSFMCRLPDIKIGLDKSLPGKESSDSEEEIRRIGNTLWCSCSKYKPMATHAESICCLDKYEICESYFKGYRRK